MDGHLNAVDHSYIRYANCWEDADLLLEGLDVSSGNRVLSIGSAGDNSFSLLTRDPELVVAVDINSVQLQLILLKKAAINRLDYSDFLKFLAFKDCEDRKTLFDNVKIDLDQESRKYWETNISWIVDGVIYQGKFERYFETFRDKLLPWIHNKSLVNFLFEHKSQEDQENFFERRWNSLRWRMLFKLFFSRKVMGWLGRDPQFVSEVDVSVSDFILEQARKELGNMDAQSNYFLDFIMRGKFSVGLPHYAREENYEIIKNNIDRLTVCHGYTGDAISQYGSFDRFNLSNIFEYMDRDTFSSVAQSIVSGSNPDAKYAYWNLMVPRDMSIVAMPLADCTPENMRDCGFFYSAFKTNILF